MALRWMRQYLPKKILIERLKRNLNQRRKLKRWACLRLYLTCCGAKNYMTLTPSEKPKNALTFLWCNYLGWYSFSPFWSIVVFLPSSLWRESLYSSTFGVCSFRWLHLGACSSAQVAKYANKNYSSKVRILRKGSLRRSGCGESSFITKLCRLLLLLMWYSGAPMERSTISSTKSNVTWTSWHPSIIREMPMKTHIGSEQSNFHIHSL